MIGTSTSRVVLVLGRFTHERKAVLEELLQIFASMPGSALQYIGIDRWPAHALEEKCAPMDLLRDCQSKGR